ncbi:MAG: hypothetical protein KC456_03815 [Flavobacteriales bacterium]|nr:hypothetical protein [Flavobacteriales bacterium]
MKNLIVLSLVFLSISVQAQVMDSVSTTEKEFLPSAKDLGITVNVNGLVSNITTSPRQDLRGENTLLFRYVINDNMTFRMGLAPTIYSARFLNTDSVGKDLVEFDSTARQSAFSIRPGLEFHFKGSKRLDPYLAIDGEAGVVGQFSAGATTNISDTTGTSKYNRTVTEAGGFSFGAKASVGFNYFVAKRLSAGLEYGMGIHYLATGGDRQEVLQIDPTSGSATTTRQLSSTRVVNTQFFVDPRVQFTLSYFFSL